MGTCFRAVAGVLALGGLCVSAQGLAPMEMRAFFSGRWSYQPRWSPDGRYLAYVARFVASGRSIVYTSDTWGWNHVYRRDLGADAPV